MNQIRHVQMNGICMPGCPACDAGEKLGRQSETPKTWVIWNKKDERSMYLREADGWEVHEVAKAPLYRPNSPEDIKQSMDLLQRIATESDCEDQGYGAIADGCTKLGCDRAPIKPDGEWLKCTKCGASYGSTAEPEERYDCPIHGTGEGAERGAKSRLIQHAALLAQGLLLPHIDTQHWYKSTPIAERRQIIEAMEAAAERHRELAIQIRALADALST